MSKASLIQTLEKLPIFSGLNPKQMKKLISFFNKVDFEPDTVICREAERQEYVYLLIRGEVAVSRDGETIKYLEPPVSLCEIGVYFERASTMTLKTTIKSSFFRISRQNLMTLIRNDIDFFRCFITNLSQILFKQISRNNKIHKSLTGNYLINNEIDRQLSILKENRNDDDSKMRVPLRFDSLKLPAYLCIYEIDEVLEVNALNNIKIFGKSTTRVSLDESREYEAELFISGFSPIKIKGTIQFNGNEFYFSLAESSKAFIFALKTLRQKFGKEEMPLLQSLS